MSTWYYVEDGDRKGPVEENELKNLLDNHTLTKESYIWTKGFENWELFKNVSEVSHLLDVPTSIPPAAFNEGKLSDIPTIDNTEETINWNKVSKTERIFSIKIGADRGSKETEYGPYSLEQLKTAYDENRINGKTFFYTHGMASWSFLADMPIFVDIFKEGPPLIKETDRRVTIRKPFVARMLFHDNEKVYEGICRDISEGGMQILVSNCPVELGDEVSMNVHPENEDYNFVASGKVVRLLDGKQGFSLRFEGLNQEAKISINSYIDHS